MIAYHVITIINHVNLSYKLLTVDLMDNTRGQTKKRPILSPILSGDLKTYVLRVSSFCLVSHFATFLDFYVVSRTYYCKIES